jgi:hypothetical protein
LWQLSSLHPPPVGSSSSSAFLSPPPRPNIPCARSKKGKKKVRLSPASSVDAADTKEEGEEKLCTTLPYTPYCHYSHSSSSVSCFVWSTYTTAWKSFVIPNSLKRRINMERTDSVICSGPALCIVTRFEQMKAGKGHLTQSMNDVFYEEEAEEEPGIASHWTFVI